MGKGKFLNKILIPIVGVGSVASMVALFSSGGLRERQSVFDGPEVQVRLTKGWWEEKWSLNQTGWRKREYNFDKILKSANIKKSELKGKKILVTLCGDCPVVADFAKAGALVTAIDYSATAIEGLKTIIPSNSTSVTVVNDDWLAVDLKDTFDIIFDRAGLTSVDPVQRDLYIKRLENASEVGSIVVLDAVVRSPNYYQKKRGFPPPSNTTYAPWIKAPNVVCGPPHHLPPAVLEDLFHEKKWNIAFSKDMEESIMSELKDESIHVAHYLAVLTRI